MTKKWQLAHDRAITLGQKSIIMGILNVTPDSFSDGGAYATIKEALKAADVMLKEGAEIIDIGAETTKPGAIPINGETERARLLPVVEALSKELDCIISVDTYRAETAKVAVEAGAHIINDVWGLQKDPAMANIVASTRAGVVIMHTGRERERDLDVIKDQQIFLEKSLSLAKKASIADACIMLDPGFGFAKNIDEAIALMRRAKELHMFHYPLLAGTSRKRFLGTLSGRTEAKDRDIATSATSVLLRMAGFSVFRVHNVGVNRDALQIADAVANND